MSYIKEFWIPLAVVIAGAFIIWLAGGFRWLARKLGAKWSERLTNEERELLAYASNIGRIEVVGADQIGNFPRAGGHDFFDQNDRSVAARYLAALRALQARGLVVHSGGVLYELTAAGYVRARKFATKLKTP